MKFLQVQEDKNLMIKHERQNNQLNRQRILTAKFKDLKQRENHAKQ